MQKVACFALIFSVAVEVSGHGMMLDPPNRSSLWRFDEEAPTNYNDNENFCGGFKVYWEKNNGRCGVCGDEFTVPHPQPNENTGKYGEGKIVANYTAGQVVETSILLTANHIGFFKYQLCELKNPNTFESGEDCFEELVFENGQSKYKVSANDYKIVNRIRLPEGFTCDRCVLRWDYTAGNNWGICNDGSDQQGCGPQETFRSCADIAIF